MKNKISLIVYSLIVLVPAVFIIIAFFGPKEDSTISLNGLDPLGLDDVKVTKKYDESEERLRKKREKFKNAVEKKWDTYKESTSKSYVTYSKDLSSRTIVDFEKGEVTIEVIVDEEDPKYDSYESKYDLDIDKQFANRYKIKKNLLSIKTRLLNIITMFVLQSDDDTNNDGSGNSSFAKQLSKLLKEKGDDGQPILKDQLVDAGGKAVEGVGNTLSAAKDLISDKTKKVRMHFAKDGKKRTIISIKIPLSDDHMEKRRQRYKELIEIEARRFNIPTEIALAIAETESAFNPKAKSHVPAYGLMQLVPKTGARDAYQWIYKKDKFITGRYLYKPRNNVELGCAYLSMIRHHYFSDIRDDERAYLCAIPAYNTGVGNVSKALIDKKNIREAAKKANKMNRDELYNKLYSDLSSKEAKNYLKKVWTRKENYK
ncbi:MAG: murein transglycosylase domain-containing protein [Candidatus Marinimicrobia bacterium]|nr:murein transglycosylase domain-containing protein [Candidatus Neomarinimicrobiota bacterium]